MKLTVLNSGSSANGYVLQHEGEAIVLECGCPLLSCEKAMFFRMSEVKAVLVTHEHKDHSRYIEDYSAYLPVYATAGTIRGCGASAERARLLVMSKPHRFGSFTVLPFPTEHDAEEPCGFLISHPACGKILFATDTYYLRYKFKGLSYIMLECNYEQHILDDNVAKLVIVPSVRSRVMRSHMSLKTCISTLKANDLSNVKGIILLHTSSNNGDKNLFRQEVEKATGKYVAVAERHLEMEFY